MSAYAPSLVEVDRDEYDAYDAVRSTQVKQLRQSSRNAVVQTATTKEMRFGTQTHALIFEPVKFALQHCKEAEWVHPWNLGGKRNPRAVEERADWNGAHEGLEEIKVADWHRMHNMRDALRLHEDARLLCFEKPGVNERAAFWEDPEWGPSKALLDRWIPEQRRIVDYKTTRDASPHGFASQAHSLGYAIQGLGTSAARRRWA